MHGLHGSSAALLLLKRIYLVVRLYQKRFIAAVGLQVGWAATGRVKLHVHGVLIEFQVARVADDGTWQGDKLLARLIIILGVFLIDDRCQQIICGSLICHQITGHVSPLATPVDLFLLHPFDIGNRNRLRLGISKLIGRELRLRKYN